MTANSLGRVGKYELVQKIATGGMAEVFLARTAGPLGFEKTLVVKRILPHLVEEPEFVEMFLSEAKLAAYLNHHNVVQIFDFGEADGAYFIAMEFIDGTNLRTLSKRAQELKRSIPFPLCAKIAALACEGLAYAHDLTHPSTGESLNVVHRDISPDNIMVTRSGGVKVVDFGIAKAASQIHRTGSGVLKGKLPYMSPEQIGQKPLDRRTDVYAMGVVLYNLVTGAKPFDTESDVSLMHAILLEPPVKARVRRPEVPEALERVVEKAMERDILQRYQNCLEMQADLERYLRACDTASGSPEIAAFFTEIAPPPQYLPGNLAPVGARTPRPSTVQQVPTVPTSAERPHKTDAGGPAAQTQEWSRGKDPAPPVPTSGKKPERRGMPPFLWVMAGGALVLGAGGYLLGRPSLERPYGEMTDAAVNVVDTTISMDAEPVEDGSIRTPQDSGVTSEQASIQKASIYIYSTKVGNLRVNGRVVGRTPIRVDDLSPGKVEFVVYDGACSIREILHLKPGDNGNRKLNVESGEIEFRVPSGTRITLDGEDLGLAPISDVKACAGEHRARFEDPTSHELTTKQIRLKANEHKIYRLDNE